MAIQSIPDKIAAVKKITAAVEADTLARSQATKEKTTQDFTALYSQLLATFIADLSDYLGPNMPRPLKAQLEKIQEKLNDKEVLDKKHELSFVAPLLNSNNCTTLEDKVRLVNASSVDDTLLKGKMKEYIQAFKELYSAMVKRLNAINKANVEPPKNSIEKKIGAIQESIGIRCRVS